MAKKIFLGMSGGVDSSVSAILLLEQGYDVTGVYMKNWAEDLPGMKCPWAEDLADAKRVAVRLGINFEVWDFREQYREKVVQYMFDEFARGRTPNPDVMCNQEIKFKVFYEQAMRSGADYIATGHYARTSRDLLGGSDDKKVDLARAIDKNKDQTYFLYRMSDEATNHVLFPVGGLHKPEVKALAAKHGLDVAQKKESMGVCFVGEVGMKDFLQTYLDTQPGEIREIESEKVLGYHDGAIFYTIGQRHGLYVGGGLPYYVVKKDLLNNIIYVSSNLNHPALWTQELALCDLYLRGGREMSDSLDSQHITHFVEDDAAVTVPDVRQKPHNQNYDCSKYKNHDRNLQKDLNQRKSYTRQSVNQLHSSIISQPSFSSQAKTLWVRLRHRAPLIPAQLDVNKLIFEQPIKRPAAGQSAVFYDDQICLGGGIIAE